VFSVSPSFNIQATTCTSPGECAFIELQKRHKSFSYEIAVQLMNTI